MLLLDILPVFFLSLESATAHLYLTLNRLGHMLPKCTFKPLIHDCVWKKKGENK